MKPETRLVALLKAKGLRLIDLAKELHVNKATVTRWSQREIPFDRVRQVEAATEIPARELRPDLAELLEGSPQ